MALVIAKAREEIEKFAQESSKISNYENFQFKEYIIKQANNPICKDTTSSAINSYNYLFEDDNQRCNNIDYFTNYRDEKAKFEEIRENVKNSLNSYTKKWEIYRDINAKLFEEFFEED